MIDAAFRAADLLRRAQAATSTSAKVSGSTIRHLGTAGSTPLEPPTSVSQDTARSGRPSFQVQFSPAYDGYRC